MSFSNTIKWAWELPQNALGYIIKKVTRSEYFATRYSGDISADIYSWKYGSGLSLGKYIFVPHNLHTPFSPESSNFIKHEFGHSIQSNKLGWLYLLVIGLPSLIWCGCFEGYRRKHNISYYSFYTEKWADKLGGVERKDNNG
jgi:hypothetical protein